jgi:hypothetical protein
VQWLVAPETLQSMAHLSVSERVPIVRQKLGLETFHCDTLRRYYHRQRVRFKRADYKYWKSLAEERDL